MHTYETRAEAWCDINELVNTGAIAPKKIEILGVGFITMVFQSDCEIQELRQIIGDLPDCHVMARELKRVSDNA